MSDEREKRRYVASVAERIAWTTGFRHPMDKHVLAILSTFGNFMTGENCRPRIEKLAARAGVSRSAAYRALNRLEEDGWIVGTHWHRHVTTYDINVDRLATHSTGAKVTLEVGGNPIAPGADLSPTADTQTPDLSPTRDTQTSDLSPTGETQKISFASVNPYLSPTGDTPISRTYGSHKEEEISIPEQISRTEESAPPLRAGRPADGEDEEAKVEVPDWGEEEVRREPTEPPATAADVCADGRDHPDDAAAAARGPGGDQAPASDAGLQLRQRADPSRPTSGDRDRGAPLGPAQPTFGPLDVKPLPSHWQRFVDIGRAALKRIDVREQRRGKGG